MLRKAWHDRVKKVVQTKISTDCLAAFNTNVDVVVHVDDAEMGRVQADPGIDVAKVLQLDADDIIEIHTKNEFLAVMAAALEEGKSHHIVLRNLDLLDWFWEIFETRQESMGGQAGIIANQVAALGAHSIIYTSLLSPKQGSMFFPEVQVPVINADLDIVDVMDGVKPHDRTKENWIFEYAKGEKFTICGKTIVTPRANRVIVATRPEGVIMGFAPDMRDHLPKLGEKVDIAFLAGFHYAPTDEDELEEYLTNSLADIKRLKQNNPHLKIHFEYVPMSDPDAESVMLQAVATEIQSFGINEVEIKRVCGSFGFTEEQEKIDRDERAYSLYKGCLRVQRKLGFERLHLHNLGYYVLILEKPYELDPTHVRDACLFGSAVNAIKAKYGGYVHLDAVAEAGELMLSDIGLEQVRAFGEEMRQQGVAVPENFAEEGVLEMDDHYVLVIPAHVIAEPRSTVGMGDTISSSSFSYEWNKKEGK